MDLFSRQEGMYLCRLEQKFKNLCDTLIFFCFIPRTSVNLCTAS